MPALTLPRPHVLSRLVLSQSSKQFSFLKLFLFAFSFCFRRYFIHEHAAALFHHFSVPPFPNGVSRQRPPDCGIVLH